MWKASHILENHHQLEKTVLTKIPQTSVYHTRGSVTGHTFSMLKVPVPLAHVWMRFLLKTCIYVKAFLKLLVLIPRFTAEQQGSLFKNSIWMTK